jgi:hypothetical protein
LRTALIIAFGLAAILSLFGIAVRLRRLRVAFRQGAWIVRKRGSKDLVRRSDQPKRFWFWTAAEAAILALTAAPAPVLLWALMYVWNSN